MKTLIKNAKIVNEGETTIGDVLIHGSRIEKIAANISANVQNTINAEGLHLIPGMIDDQVHFRDPGLTYKADIATESAAAIAGGITSIMDMPNTIPNTLTLELLENKYQLASRNSLCNYSFFMGINKTNLEEALKIDNEKVCGLTDDGLYFSSNEGIMANHPKYLENLFSRTNSLVALHCEDDEIIKQNTEKYTAQFGEEIPLDKHALIRSEEACYQASKRVIDIAKKHKNRLHIYHVSTAKECELFDSKVDIREKRITAEACVHHLFFSNEDYEKLGAKIKWNPSIKTKEDKEGLLKALLENKLDIIATDHAPHSIEEKNGNYFNAHSGGPLVQHALTALLELYHQNKISLEKIVEKTSHHVAEIYRLKERGYIREGYFADLVLLNLNDPWQVTKSNLLYKCQWSPFENYKFKSKVIKTFVNGNEVYTEGKLNSSFKGERLHFVKHR